MQRVQVWSLIRGLRFYVPCGQKNQDLTEKQHHNKFSKDFKKMTHIKKSSTKKAYALMEKWKAIANQAKEMAVIYKI